MRIALFAPTSRDAPRGGAEGVFAALATDLSAGGYEVTRVHTGDALGQDDTDEGPVWSVPLVGSRAWDTVLRPGFAVRALASAQRFARCFRVVRPDIVNVHFVDALAAYVLALRPLFGYRVVLTAHGSDVLRPRGEVHPALLPRLLARADAVVAVSDDVGGRVRSLAPTARVSVIQNGVDLAFWAGGAGWEPTPGRIVQVGALRSVKGQDVMLDALARLRRQVPEARLDLVGDGPARAALEAQAERLGVAHATTFVGRVGPEAVRERLGTAAVAVLPSRSEGMPLTLLEAMAASVPVVATDVGGIPEVAGDPPSVALVPPEDPAALAEALARVLTDRAAASDLEARGRERASAFSWDRTLAAYEALFADVVGRGRSFRSGSATAPPRPAG